MMERGFLRSDRSLLVHIFFIVRPIRNLFLKACVYVRDVLYENSSIVINKYY